MVPIPPARDRITVLMGTLESLNRYLFSYTRAVDRLGPGSSPTTARNGDQTHKIGR
jgi:hypothetical protein